MPRKTSYVPPEAGLRLKKWRELRGLSQGKLAEALGVGQASLSRIEAGKGPISGEVIYNFACTFQDVDIREILCGVQSTADAIAIAHQVRPIIRAAADSLDDLPQQGMSDDYLAVPLVAGKVAAGPGGVVWEQVDSLVWVYRPALGRRHRLIAVRVGGDSMQPTVPDGAIVIIDLDQWQPNGGRRHIWALRTKDGETQIKRLHRMDTSLIVISDNFSNYPPEPAWTADLNQLVIGKVIWMWRSLE